MGTRENPTSGCLSSAAVPAAVVAGVPPATAKTGRMPALRSLVGQECPTHMKSGSREDREPGYFPLEAGASGLRDAPLSLAVWVAASSAHGPDEFHVGDAAPIPPAVAMAVTAGQAADAAVQQAVGADPERGPVASRHSGVLVARLGERYPPWAELLRCRAQDVPQDDFRCSSRQGVHQRVAYRRSQANWLASAVQPGAEQPQAGSETSGPSVGFRLTAVRQPVVAAECSGLARLPGWANSFQSPCSGSVFQDGRSPLEIAAPRAAERSVPACSPGSGDSFQSPRSGWVFQVDR
jgi:hypothetical protein